MKLVNNGNLALKYETEFSHNYNVSKGKSVLGNYYYVGDYLKIARPQSIPPLPPVKRLRLPCPAMSRP